MRRAGWPFVTLTRVNPRNPVDLDRPQFFEPNCSIAFLDGMARTPKSSCSLDRWMRLRADDLRLPRTPWRRMVLGATIAIIAIALILWAVDLFASVMLKLWT